MAKNKNTVVADDVVENASEQATATSDIRDVDLSVIAKKRFRLDGDDNRIIEINTSDLGIIKRLENAEEKLLKLADSVTKMDITSTSEDGEDDEFDSEKFNEALADIDKQMRDLIDYIFDSPVADKAGNCGTMYDPVNGKLRYEHIIDRLVGLYEADLRREASAISHKARMRASKYTR